MKSKLQILYETVYSFVQCWYDGEPDFLERATSIQFLPKRVAFILSELVRATSDRLEHRETKPSRVAPRTPEENPTSSVVVYEPQSPSVEISETSENSETSARTSLTDADNYIQMAHRSVQKLSLIALGHMINSDARNVTVTSLTETVKTLTLTLCAQERPPKNTTSCPVS